MKLPQLILLGLMILALGITLAKHGQPKNDKYNFGISLIANAIEIGLLYWGGFFN